MSTERDTEYSPAGTWYGGSAAAKYLYNFIPGENGRHFLTCSAAYSPELLGAALVTTFTGELKKVAENSYEIRLMGLSRKNPADPEELPVIAAAKGDAELDGHDKMTITYNMAGFYEWDKVPLVDEALSMIATEEKPVVEELKHMPMGT
jgi:hypothetical protein